MIKMIDKNFVPEKVDDISQSYFRAQSIVQGFMTKDLVRNDTIFPTWIRGEESFWYKRDYQYKEDNKCITGFDFRLVCARSLTNVIAFDHQALAVALEHASGNKVNALALPVSHLEVILNPLVVNFKAFGRCWTFSADTKQCKPISPHIANDDEAISPDGKWVAFPKNNNLWLRCVLSGEEKALTDDGTEDYYYAKGSSAWGKVTFSEIPGLWSSDSKRFLTIKRDKRQLKVLPHVDHVPSDESIRPKLEEYKISYPGDDDVETFEFLIIDVSNGNVCKPCLPQARPASMVN